MITNPQSGYKHEYIGFDKKTWKETSVFKGVKQGGSFTRILTNIRESGTLPVSGVSDLPEMVRIYATDLETNDRFPLATMRVVRPSSTIKSSSVGDEGDVELRSVLTFAEQDGPDGAYVCNQGLNPVELAASIFTNLGLKVLMTPANSSLSSTRVYYGSEWNWLTIANDLLSAANYSSADIDRQGTVILSKYKELSDKNPVVSFSDVKEGRKKYQAPISSEDDWFSVPNVYEVVYETEDLTLIAMAYDNDSESRLSISNRGYRVKESETVTDFDYGYIDTTDMEDAKEELSDIPSEITSTEAERLQAAADLINTTTSHSLPIFETGTYTIITANVTSLISYATTWISTTKQTNLTNCQAGLNKLALQKLRSAQSNVAANEFTGQFVKGLNISDACELEWKAADKDFIRSVYSMEISLTPSMQVKYRIREYMRGNLTNSLEDDE